MSLQCISLVHIVPTEGFNERSIELSQRLSYYSYTLSTFPNTKIDSFRSPPVMVDGKHTVSKMNYAALETIKKSTYSTH